MSTPRDIFAVPREVVEEELATERDRVASACRQLNQVLADLGVIQQGTVFARPGGPQRTLVTFTPLPSGRTVDQLLRSLRALDETLASSAVPIGPASPGQLALFDI